MPLIGTAGHVDHGKSTLIEKLTGRDPDRWKEEKDRGLTIDLGFAWAVLPSGTEVSFVDVPGHERYMKNMLAGIEAIDVAVLVVAADEGWMPQTEEHLAVLDLLDISRGVVALTKVDIVDDDLAELASLEVSERLEGTSLTDARVVPVSAVTGLGLEDLVSEIERLVGSDDRGDSGRPRLWVDRSFPVSGAGTVVTGSLLGGHMAIDETVELYPGGTTARVRGIQSHESELVEAAAGRRVALNLSGVDHSDVARGQMVGRRGQWAVTSRISARIRTARYADEIGPRGAFTIHVGSGAQRVKITGRSDKSAIIQLAEPISVTGGDRFILRDTGRKLVVGGGEVVDVAPGSNHIALPFADNIESLQPDDLATDLLKLRNFERLKALSQHTSGGSPMGARVVGDFALDPLFADNLASIARELVSSAHASAPLRPGLPLATLAEQLGIDISIAEAVVADSNLVRQGPDIATAGFSPQPTPDQMETWRSARGRLTKGLDVPNASELGLDPELLAHLIRGEELVRISDSLVYVPEQIETLEQVASQLGEAFTVAEFRDATELSRKYAVPILEWMDKEGLTVRRGETRRFR